MNRGTALFLGVALAVASLSYGESRAAGPPPSGGTVAIEPRTGDGEYDPSMPAFVDAASAAFTARGFTVFDDPAHAAYVAQLILSRARVGTGLGKDPEGAPVGVVGTGVVVPFSTGQSNVVSLQRTRLELRIRKRGDDTPVWDGAAVTVRATGTRKGEDKSVASDLSQALLQSYPAEPRDVIGIP